MIKKIIRKGKFILKKALYSDLTDNGERVDVIYKKGIKFDTLDMYQKSHYRRYEFAQGFINGGVVADFACGNGYGTVMLSQKGDRVIGADISKSTVDKISKRYASINNVKFVTKNLLDLEYKDFFDTIVSFETIEHFKASDIPSLFAVFHTALKPDGQFIFSVPYMQEQSENAIKMGFHLTFDIDEKTIGRWLQDAGFTADIWRYQNYETHTIEDVLEQKDFIICVARKI